MDVLSALGVNPFTAILLAIIGWIAWSKASYIVGQNDKQAKQLVDLDMSIKLVGQEMTLHSEDDIRRFEDIHAHLRGNGGSRGGIGSANGG